MTLEEEFALDLAKTYREAAQHGYNPTYFMKMLTAHGGLQTAKRLVTDGQVQTGLFRLAELGLHHISVENLLLNPKYAELFTAHEKDSARKRLRQLSFEPGGWG